METVGVIPKYVRANRSHCLYTRNFHFHAWHKQPCSKGTQTGMTLKQRTGSGLWRHWTAKSMAYKSSERGCGKVRHYELGWHDSKRAKGDRVYGSKRYLRFKICL